jgi:MftR C-terminal domain
MSAPTDPPAGLRERKKIKLRRTIQAEALRLSRPRATSRPPSSRSPKRPRPPRPRSTRYFPTKEDVVLDDDYDPIVEATIASRPAGEALTDTFRAATAAVAAASETDQDNNLARLSLIATAPALDARYAGEQRRSIDLIARLLADRTGRTGRLSGPARRGRVHRRPVHRLSALGSQPGSVPLRTLVDQAVTTVEPLLAALEHPARSED